jgi:hypothetical protein
MKRADIVKLINPGDWIESFEKQIDDKIEGWIILWNGKMIKPRGGNSYYYASEKAALQAIERNISFHAIMRNDICMKLHGFIYYDLNTQTLMGEYNEQWKEYYMQEEYTAHWKLDARKRKEIEEENSPEYQLMQQRRDEWRLIETVSGNAVKTVLVPAWIKEGKLEIKEAGTDSEIETMTQKAIDEAREIMESFDESGAMTVGFENESYTLTGKQMTAITAALYLADCK